MARLQKRQPTKYPGVFYLETERAGGSGKEKTYYVVFKRKGKVIEAKAGKQYQDNMTPAKAAAYRGDLIEGKALTQAERRKIEKQRIWTLIELWTEYKKNRENTKSLHNDDLRFEKYIKPTLGKKKPADLVPLDFDRLKRKMLKENKSPQTCKHVLALIKRICNFGVNKALCHGLSFRPEMPKFDNTVTEDLTPTQLKMLMDAIESDEDVIVSSMMKLALYSGMRRGEMLKLKWDDLDFEKSFIRIIGPKGGKDAIIPMNEMSKNVLKGMPKTSEYVFPGKGGRMRRNTQKTCQRIREAAGLPKSFRPLHGLRHVYASNLASSGQVDMYVLQKLLTHKSPQMTQRYAHLRDESLRAASDIAGEIVPKKKTS